MSEHSPSRVAVGAALGLAVLLALGVIIASKIIGSSTPDSTPPAGTTAAGPVALVPVDAPDAGSTSCATLITALPATLANGPAPLRRAPIADPAPVAAMAWRAQGRDPVVLRCGLGKPGELTPTAQLRVISGVNWLPVEGDGATTWFVVDRAVYVALTVPADAGTGPLQDVSAAVATVLPAR